MAWQAFPQSALQAPGEKTVDYLRRSGARRTGLDLNPARSLGSAGAEDLAAFRFRQDFSMFPPPQQPGAEGWLTHWRAAETASLGEIKPGCPPWAAGRNCWERGPAPLARRACPQAGSPPASARSATSETVQAGAPRQGRGQPGLRSGAVVAAIAQRQGMPDSIAQRRITGPHVTAGGACHS